MPSLTLADLRQRVSISIGMDNTDGSEDQEMIDAYVNEGVEQVLLDTKCHVETADLALTSDDGDYDLPDGILFVERVMSITTDGNRPLEVVAPEDIRWFRRTQSSSIPPVRYYAIAGTNRLMLYPTPDSSSDQIEMDYIPTPTAMTSSSSTPQYLPFWLHPLVESYAKWKCADLKDDQTSQQGARYQQDYQMGVRQARERVKRAQGRRRPQAQVGRRARFLRLPLKPSQDTGA